MPVAWYELNELALCSCPEKPLMAYRKNLITGNKKIGKVKRLTASMADSAIAGARGCLATGPRLPDQRTKARPIVPEPLALTIKRGYWYFDNEMEVIIARPAHYELTPEEEELVFTAAGHITYLEWSEEAVFRLAGPEEGDDCTRLGKAHTPACIVADAEI